jgi:hypothetical protein
VHREKWESLNKEEPLGDLEAHIARYKTKTQATSFMNLKDLPELGNELNNLGDMPELGIDGYKINNHVLEALGPEQVSPHYENFGMSRKIFFTFAGISSFVSLMKLPGNASLAAYSAFGPVMGMYMLLYVFMEGRKSTVLPLLSRFYSNTCAAEIVNLMKSYQEDMHGVYRRREDKARQQLEYFDLHKEFRAIKEDAVRKLLDAEETILKQHIHKRALNLLQGAQQMETANRKKITSEVLANVKEQMKQIRENPTEDIKKDAFARALDGIRNGQIDYGQDLVLQKVLDITKAEVEKVNSLSEKEKDQMLCLTEAQIQSLKAADEMAQREFLQKRPVGLEGVFKDHEGFGQTMSQW